MNQGAALLIVLLTLSGFLACAAGLALQGRANHRHVSLDLNDWQFRLLLDDANHLTRTWLRDHGTSLRTPSGSPFLPTLVLQSSGLTEDGVDFHLTVQAWDAASGWPTDRSLELGQGIPRDITYDPEASRESWWLRASSQVRNRFPVAFAPDSTPCIALLFSPFSSGAVNWLTCDPQVLQATLEKKGHPEVLASILQIRDSGQPVTSLSHRWLAESPPYLVSSSSRWLTATHIAIGEHRRTWIQIQAGVNDTPIFACEAPPPP